MLRIRYFLLLALIAYFLTGIYQVAPEERAVVRRFGKIVERPGPGLWVGLPWGIDRVDRVPVRTVRQLRVGYNPDEASEISESSPPPPGQLLTGDQNLVNVQIVLDYAIGEADQDLDDFVMHREQVDATLSRAAEAAAAEWIAGRTVDQVLLTGSGSLPTWVMDRLTERLPEFRLGVRVQRVSVAYLAPPEEVRAAFEAVTQAQTAIRTREFQAQQERSQRLRQAEAIKYKLEQEADEYRDSKLRQANADATDFLARLKVYREVKEKNPDVLAFLWWNEMRKTLLDLKTRGGRVEPLDAYLGKDGLDITQLLSPKK